MSTVRKEVHLSEQTAREFERIFPKASLSWAVDMLLEKFLAQYKHSPEEYAAIAAADFKEEISK